MHPQSPTLTIGGTVLKEYLLEVIFDSKMTFEKHLRSVSRTASQRLGLMRKSWGLICQFWSTVLQCCAQLQIHLKQLDRVASGARF